MNNQPKFKKGDSPVVDMLAIPDDHVWPVTPDNEVVIVDENRTENHILKDLRYAETPAQKDKFFNELTEFRKKQADQELEDVAEARYKTVPEKTKWICKDCFKHGATWQKEQSANDAIEFSKWWFNHGFTYDRKENRWRKYPSEKRFTDDEMIELWHNRARRNSAG